MEIKIGKSARDCAACEKLFEHEGPIHSCIRREDDEFIREDFCPACWNEERAEHAFSAWQSQFYDPQVAEAAPEESFSPLRRIFYDAVEGEARPQIAVAYLAAQLLRRQKVFRLIKESKDPETEAALILFSDRIGNRLIEVHDPNLAHAELDDARIALQAKLNEIENPDAPEDESGDGEEAMAAACAEGEHDGQDASENAQG
jgi:hypothetical protein